VKPIQKKSIQPSSLDSHSRGALIKSVRPAQRQTQSGQVLVWFLAFMATLSLVFAGVYSVGQATSEKQKTVNAADAAAYTGALVEARALNFTAYTNRAIIANEVFLAQVVSLDSWTSYFEVATDNYAKLFGTLKSIPYVGVVFGILETTMRTLNRIMSPIAKGVDSSIAGTVSFLELSYAGWYGVAINPAFAPGAMALSAKKAAENTLEKNVATQGGRIDTAPVLVNVAAYGIQNEMEWQRLTKMYSKTSGGRSGDDRKYAADILLASRDEFSTNRTGSELPFLNTLFGNSTFCIPYIFKVGSEKQGPTRLMNYDRWEAQDTLEYKMKIGPNGCSWGKGGTAAVPVGWGRATSDKSGKSGDRINTEGGAGARAFGANHRTSGWTGVKDVYDVKRKSDGRPEYEEVSFTIAVAKNKADIRNNEALGFESRPMAGPLGSPDLKAGFAKDQIGAIAEARVFFSRPVRNSSDITASSLFRADNHREYASLYNPYWQVRLSEVSDTKRALAYGVGGLNPALTPFTPK
jgi:Putative Flp pilus-assembly TadE/G-like